MAGLVMCNACSVRPSCLLSSFPQEVWTKPELKLRRLRFEPREEIFHQGVPVAGLYILCQGCAKLVFRTSWGKKVLIRFCSLGDLLAGMFAEEHAMSAVAIDAVVVTLLPRELELGLYECRPELAVEVGRRLSRDQHMLLGRLAYLAYGSVKERLAKGLLELGRHYGVRCEGGFLIDLPLSQRDLADLIGASRQTVCQELQAFIKQGLVRTEGSKIVLADPEALRCHG